MLDRQGMRLVENLDQLFGGAGQIDGHNRRFSAIGRQLPSSNGIAKDSIGDRDPILKGLTQCGNLPRSGAKIIQASILGRDQQTTAVDGFCH